MHNWNLFCLALTFLWVSFLGFNWAEEDIFQNGTLIVVYQTDREGDRLDRIRFWLKDAELSQKMYPRGNSFVEDQKNMTRTVVIEDLFPGDYTLEFVIPNKDAHYEDLAPRRVTIRPGEVVRIDQNFKKREVPFHSAKVLREWLAWIELVSQSDETAQLLPPLPPPQMAIIGGSLSVESNLETAEWILFQGDTVAYRGVGSISDLIIPAGYGYLIRAKPLSGHTVKIYPPGRFRIARRQSFVARLVFEPAFGFIDMSSEMPSGETLVIDISSENLRQSLHLDLRPQNGKIEWSSGAIPIGTYTLTFHTSPNIITPSPLNVLVEENEHVRLTPDFSKGRDLTVKSNTAEAIYLLQQEDTDNKWQGSGMQYTFKGIPAGRYTLKFTSSNPDYLVPPQEKEITLESRPEEVKVAYQIVGYLEVITNVDKAQVTIISKSHPSPTLKDEMLDNKKSYRLLPGDYHIVIEQNGRQQKNQDITLKAYEKQIIHADFEEGAERISRQDQAQIVVVSNILEAKFKILKKDDGQKPVGVYKGKYVSILLEPHMSYEIIFEPWENYTSPQNINFQLEAGEHRIIRADYVPSQKLVVVPEGKVILGDVFNEGMENERPTQIAHISQFSIGVYEVTNALFAEWLSKAVKEGRLVYLSDFEKKGQVIDHEGRLICKTIESDSYSQIMSFREDGQGTVFRAFPGKENFPVIDVTWYGAEAYCIDNNCRLPTEAEWEKAAAMALDNAGDQPLKKYRYGFSQNNIDKTWANYKYTDQPITSFQVRTTEIGFYNGVNLLPLSSDEKTQLRTNDAKSPVGAYDMSGNVFEWVADWYGPRQSSSDPVRDPKGPSKGTEKIAKGGCYDSLAEELRVSKRLPLAPDYCDAYTGFRIAK